MEETKDMEIERPRIKTGLSGGEKVGNISSKILRIFYSISVLIVLLTLLLSKDPDNRLIGYLMLAAGLLVAVGPWLKKKFFPGKK